MAAIILDIGQHLLFKPVTLRGNEKENGPFLHIFFSNESLDAINLGNILHHKSVELWFPLISKINLFLSFHIPILHLFNYRIVLQNFNIHYLCVAHIFRMLCCVVCFCLRPVSCVPIVASVSGLSILD